MNSTRRGRIFIAAPVFSEGEEDYNLKLGRTLSSCFDITSIRLGSGLLNSTEFVNTIKDIDECDMFLIDLDGRVPDEGAVFCLGYAYSKNKICLGIQTDPRRIVPMGNNPMIECALKRKFNSRKEMFDWFCDY